ncbi:MAG: 2-amino-4-hydroxy-6-hydroxymethyldihydropteridine diphosphokinase [Alphaproteobacteria bacterium]|nr:2-amino-4-hydroxy-6-hydroxymethyldihydropteridine diphosphokinase [Alphaproteobacteria bacterium]
MILIALGANLPSQFGPPEETIQAAYTALARRGIAVRARSSVWLSAPVPVSNQPWYRNAVAQVETALDIPALLDVLKEIEAEFGRESRERNAARPLDLDIIAYNDDVLESADISVPHPRAHERAFVLLPLQEVCAGWIHPVLAHSVEDLIAALPPGQDIRKQGCVVEGEAAE